MSKYNRKLPQPSDICFMDSKRGNRKTTITMPFGGVIPSGVSYMGWKQTSFTYSYQVQYYVKARLIPSKQLDTGATYSKTDWKYPNTAWGSVKPDSLNKGVKLDKKNRWYRYFNFANRVLMAGGVYDKLQIYIRVRSYNSKAKQHGPWKNGSVVVKCVPTVKVHKLVALADGGLRVYLDTGRWTRGDSQLILKDVRHAEAVSKENVETIHEEVDAIGGEEAVDYPYVDIGGTNFNGQFLPNESVTFKNCVFRTCDGVDASIDGTYRIDASPATISKPVVTAIARDEATGTISATFGKSDASEDWDKSEAWLTCDVRGKAVRVNHVSVKGIDDSARTYKFQPPLDSPIKLHFGISNDLGGTAYLDLTEEDHEELKPFKSNGRVMVNYSDGTETQPKNGRFYGSKVAAMLYDTDLSSSASRAFDSELPFGRKRPVAFMGEGIEKTINVKGSIDASEDGYFEDVPHSSFLDWLAFEEQQGLVFIRLPDAFSYHAVTESVSIAQEEFEETREVSLTFREVSV